MKKRGWIALMCLCALLLGGCAGNAEVAPMATPEGAEKKADEAQVSWPKDRLNAGEGGVPLLNVYVTDKEQVESMDVETYVQGVLAGEMKNDWPLEALKAQAILARTFVLKFIEEKKSRYEGADISTDIEEAQAYDASAINDRIRQAVAETKGLVLSAGGELPYAWFHAHSGGVTERAKEGLGWEKEEPSYTQTVQSNEPESVTDEKEQQNLSDAQSWGASFPFAEFEAACAKQGANVTLSGDTALTISQRGDSGRAVKLSVDGREVNATDLRIALGSTKMRSTLLTSLKVADGAVTRAGKGYGLGVGRSQWGAYGMAEEGKTAEEIVMHYFREVSVQKLW